MGKKDEKQSGTKPVDGQALSELNKSGEPESKVVGADDPHASKSSTAEDTGEAFRVNGPARKGAKD